MHDLALAQSLIVFDFCAGASCTGPAVFERCPNAAAGQGAHVLRHSCTTFLMQAGVTPFVAAGYLGITLPCGAGSISIWERSRPASPWRHRSPLVLWHVRAHG